MKVTVLIPARMAATRFPGKPLSKILGKPMIQWVYERSQRANVDDVVVATDSLEIREAVLAFGGKCELTRDDHPNGTSRIAEVASNLATDIVINVQGDEPGIHPQVIDAVVEPFRSQPDLEMTTMAAVMENHEDVFNPNIVKVVFNRKSRALYFSRAPIPYGRHQGMNTPRFPAAPHLVHHRHIGIYGYRKPFLMRYAVEPPCALESIEGLEQLRALDMGATIYVGITTHTAIGVDEPADLEKAASFLVNEGSVP